MPAPNKAERAKCWTSKDAYWKCLDENPDNQGKCSQLKTDYEGSCSSTWVKYFNRRRDYLKFKSKLEKEGYEPITDSNKNAS